MRPMSLADVARRTAAGDSFDRCLANFLDEFYASPQIVAFLEKPILLQQKFGDLGLIQDAYLAATAEELARCQKIAMSGWIFDEKRSLRVCGSHEVNLVARGRSREIVTLERTGNN